MADATIVLLVLALVAAGFAVAWWHTRGELKDARDELEATKTDKTKLETQLASEQQAHEKFSEQIKTTFAELAGDALSKNNKEFLNLADERFKRLQQQSESSLEQRQEAVKNLVEPIKTALNENKQTIAEIEKNRREAYGEITQQIKNMSQDQSELRKETGKLVNALRRPQVRGRYGEVALRRVVELAGMSAYCDFIEQAHATDGDGGVIRPDMVVNMPNQRALIIDAKTPLENYLNAVEAVDAEVRGRLLEKHANDVREHIKGLALKSYWAQFERTPEFVVMFIPGDQFLHAALEQKPDLLEYAMENKIILTTPGSLMGLLRAVAYGWQQETIAENLNEIKKSGENLLDCISTFITHINKLGKSLEGGMDAYNKAVGSFERRLVPAARQLSEHDIRGKKELPDTRPVADVVRTLSDDSDTKR